MSQRDICWMKLMAAAKRWWGCHQLPERSFFIGGYQWPLCARCTGIVAGYLLAATTYAMCLSIPLFVSGLLLLPLVLDGSIQMLFAIMSNNRRRLITGLLYGVGSTRLTVDTLTLAIQALF